MKQIFLKSILLITVLSNTTFAQVSKRVLFIGNSYIGVNNLPLLTAQYATAMGDTLIYDSNTPGGSTFANHTTNAISTSKIALGTWHDVILQGQSQEPSFPDGQVQTQTYPYAQQLDSLINAANPCTNTLFYMTWGRKNGDASNCAALPALCTYAGMDSLLRLRYQYMAVANNASVSPVGAVWRYIRNNYPSIELYAADESHPSLAGSYAAAATFYTALFYKNPLTCTYTAGLDATTALQIRQAAKAVVYDSLNYWRININKPTASFTHSISFDTILQATNTSTLCSSYNWYINNTLISTTNNITYNFTQLGTYTLTLVGSNCNKSDTSTAVLNITKATSIVPTQAAVAMLKYNNYTRSINYTQVPANSTLYMYNMLGGKVAQYIIAPGSNTITLPQLPPGIYFAVINTSNYRLAHTTINLH
jgi:hypothetical protein